MNRKELFTESDKKGCILLFGESFRLGGQHSRQRGTDESYASQIEAAKSQMNFIKDKKIDIDVYLASYDTPFSKDLVNIYEDKVIGYEFHPDLLGWDNLIKNAIQKISIEDYDYILIMRIDLLLKPMFTEIFNPTWNTIQWPSICFKPYHKSGIHPRVNSMITFVPKKYYRYFNEMTYGHDIWEHLIEHTDLTIDDLDTMLNTFHDSDSEKDFNPLYYIVNREESKIQHTQDYFDKRTFYEMP